MQFGGQRTDINLQPIGQPHDLLIKLSEDILPDPDAVLITGITPQQTISEGLTEVEFLKIFQSEIATPDTIFIGFNSLRFDDEFMRHLLYRNFYDAYEWQWKDGRSRWDLLDVVRMTRALRPEGIVWPVDSEGKPSCRLSLLTSVNGLDHEQAHNALNDVGATIALAQLVRAKQPKLFSFLFDLHSKKAVAAFVKSNKLFVYSSGKYSGEHEKTTVVAVLTDHPDGGGVLVYNLRHDPTDFADMTPAEMLEAWKWKKDRDDDEPRLPVKTLKFNHCPAIAPLGVLDPSSRERLHLDMDQINKHHKQLGLLKDWTKRVLEALKLMDQQRQASLLVDERTVDEQLYDGFIPDNDKKLMNSLQSVQPAELSDFAERFSDQRLRALLPLYKGRNYPLAMNDDERSIWDKHVYNQLLAGDDKSRAARYFARLGELSERTDLSGNDKYILEELQLYGQSILPV